MPSEASRSRFCSIAVMRLMTGRDLLHHAPVHGGLGEREAAELLRLDDAERHGRLGLHAHAERRPRVSAPIAPIQVGAYWRPAGSTWSPGDEERLHRALEQQEHARRRLALLGEDLARLRPRAARVTASHSPSCGVVEVVEEVDRPQLARA